MLSPSSAGILLLCVLLLVPHPLVIPVDTQHAISVELWGMREETVLFMALSVGGSGGHQLRTAGPDEIPHEIGEQRLRHAAPSRGKGHTRGDRSQNTVTPCSWEFLETPASSLV